MKLKTLIRKLQAIDKALERSNPGKSINVLLDMGTMYMRLESSVTVETLEGKPIVVLEMGEEV